MQELIQNLDIERLFRPGNRIEVVFNIDDLAPVVRTSTIHDCNHDSSGMIISQSNPKILPSYNYQTMDITALVIQELNRKFRIGLQSKIVKFIQNYQLSKDTKEDAILLKYSPKPRVVNIRAAYRLEPKAKLEIEGKLLHKDKEYESGKHYKVHDSSVTGGGLIVHK